MKTNADIYYSVNNEPFVKRSGSITKTPTGAILKWQDDDVKLEILLSSGSVWVENSGQLSYNIDFTKKESATEIVSPYGSMTVAVENAHAEYEINDDSVLVKCGYTLNFADAERQGLELVIRGRIL